MCFSLSLCVCVCVCVCVSVCLHVHVYIMYVNASSKIPDHFTVAKKALKNYAVYVSKQ